jgi:hypothetical protein
MSVYDLLTKSDPDKLRHQFLSQSITNVVVKGGAGSRRRKDRTTPRHSEVTFVTDKLTPFDVVEPKQAEYLGIVVWVPRTEYERLQKEETK